jgi:Flp pilus assembly protein TadG
MILKLHRKLNRIRKRFCKNQRGAAALEFAFVGGPFFFLMMGTMEAGMTLFSEHSIQQATTTASRLIRTGQAQGGGFSAEEFKQRLCQNLPAMLDCDKVYINVEVRTSFSDAQDRADASSDGQLDESVTNGAAFEPGNAGDIIVVETFYEWELYTPFLMQLLEVNGTAQPAPHWLANHGEDKRLVRGVAVFRNEPFS